MSGDLERPEHAPHALLEFSGMAGSNGATCSWLTPAIKAKLRELSAGQVLEVRVNDPTARDDILSWSRLSGTEVLTMDTDAPGHLRFYLRKK